MTDETVESGEVPASETPDVESVAPDTTPDVAEQPEQPEQPEKHKAGFQKRIAELVQERNDYRRSLEQERRRIDQLVELVTQKQEPEKAPEAPTLESVGYDESKYQAAIVEYAKAEARKEVQQTLRTEREQSQRQAKTESFKTREAEYAKGVDDYVDAVYDPNTPISQTMAEVIADSDLGPQLAYHLAKNRAEAQAIYGMSPVAAARELGRLEAKLSVPKPPPVSKAPPPAPVVKATEPEINEDPDTMSIDKWMKWREKQIKKNAPSWARK
jgi:hypothetical protein